MVKFSSLNGSFEQANEIKTLQRAKADLDQEIERFRSLCDDLRVDQTYTVNFLNITNKVCLFWFLAFIKKKNC